MGKVESKTPLARTKNAAPEGGVRGLFHWKWSNQRPDGTPARSFHRWPAERSQSEAG